MPSKLNNSSHYALDMKCRTTLLFALITIGYVATFAADAVITPALRLMIDNRTQSHKVQATDAQRMRVIVSTDNTSGAWHAVGGRLQSYFGSDVILDIPVDSIESLAALPGVRSVDCTRRVYPLSDVAREVTGADLVTEGRGGLPQAFDGTGVIVGVIDVGVDFGHIAFRDTLGNCRIKAVYLPTSTVGDPVVIDGDTLPGSMVTGEAIASLETDAASSHGNHVIATAAGTQVGLYGGMAPGSELAVCALSNDGLTNADVANAARFLARYARKRGMPCVINISLGSHEGPHDGTSFLSRCFEDIACDSLVVVLASGNEQGSAGYLHGVISDATDSVASFVTNFDRGKYEMWSRDDREFEVRLLVADRNGNRLYTSPPMGKELLTLSSATNPTLAAFATGSLRLATEHNVANGKWHIVAETDFKVRATGNRLGLLWTADAPVEFDVWAGELDGPQFNSFGIDGYTDGSDSCSVSDMATGPSVISVGSYISRSQYPNYSGTTISQSGLTIGALSSFSSYGTDINGRIHPTVCAPGQRVIAAINRAERSQPVRETAQTVADEHFPDENRYYIWGAKAGTSMASPVVSGIIALWLQANPRLNGPQVAQIISQTAQRNEYYNARWGENGAIRALEGLQAAIDARRGDINGDGSVDVSDVSALINTILGVAHYTTYLTDVTGNGSVDVSDVTSLINIILGI